MLAVLHLLQMNDIADTPEIVKLLLEHTWTSLTPTDLIQLGATVHALDPQAINNVVLPGTPGWAGAASVVRLTPEADDMLVDVGDDGLLSEGDGWSQTDRYPARSSPTAGPRCPCQSRS
jgi:hypothetical protein